MRVGWLVLVLALAGCGPDRSAFELSAELVTPTDIALTWRGGPEDAVANVVEFATEPSGPYTVLEFLPAGRTSFEHPDLMPSTPFYYRVRSVHGPASPPVEVTMPEGASAEPGTGGRVVPASVSGGACSGELAELPSPSEDVTGSLRVAGSLVGDRVAVPSLSQGGVVPVSGGLCSGGPAGLSPLSRDGVGLSGPSRSGGRVEPATSPEVPLPGDWAEPVTLPDERARPSGMGGPTNLTAAVVAPDGVRFTWTDNAAVEVGYLLESRPVGASEYRVVAVVDADVNAFGLVTLPSERVAAYRVRAYEYGAMSTVAHRTTGIS